MFWDSLSREDQGALLEVGVRKQYALGDVIFRDYEQPSHVLIIWSGLVKLTRTSLEGRQVLLDLRGAGHLLGELGVVTGSPRAATAVVLENVAGLVVSVDEFKRIMLDRASVSFAVLEQVVVKLQQATDRRLEARAGDIQARLCGRLAELAAGGQTEPDGSIVIRSPLTQQELADWIGASRDAVVLALRNIRDLGWVETGRKTVRIRDLQALQSASAG